MAEARVISVSGTMKWELRYYDNGVSLKAVSELQKPILDTWYCVEVEGKSNTTTDAEARIYINGNELTDVSQTGKNNTLPINCAYMWINSAGTTIWYDCVVVDRAYIGPEPHDIAVTNVTSSKKIICQGFSGNVTTTIANNGDYSENVNVTIAVVNSTGAQFTIGSFMNVPVNNGTSTDLTLTWNTTGFAKDSYTISAYAEPVQGETNTADNTLTDGIVKITIIGDLNGDGKVNLVDVFKVALAYGSVQGDSRWDPNLDINNDGKINLIDYFITALNFGKSDP
jgi:hypothetical protein